MRIKHNTEKWGRIGLIWLLLPWLVLVLGGCGGGEEIDSSSTETSVTSSSAQAVGQEGATATTDGDESSDGDRFFRAAGTTPADDIPPEVQREFDRLAGRILESQKTDPRSRPSDQAMSDLEDFLRRIELPEPVSAKAAN